MNSKNTMAKDIFTNNISLFICPICHKQLSINNNSLVCINNHNFDISKKGTVSLYKTSKLKDDKLYSTNLFYNRRLFINYGFYQKTNNIIIDIIKKKFIKPTILDLGCGEGTFGYNIKKEIENSLILGIDLSKAGINHASDYLPYNYLPILADLNNIPIKDNSCDVIINILSPINKNEVYRLLRDNGIIIKVTPKKEYLKELRNMLEIKEYENETVIENNILNNYIVEDKFETNETLQLTTETLNNLIEMTPLTKHKINNNNNKIDKITIALNIYILKKKEK